ncbi:Uncharacterised protein [Pseudomonas putida]|nr:Uncharacterised protein [Pseudomonas putida]
MHDSIAPSATGHTPPGLNTAVSRLPKDCRVIAWALMPTSQSTTRSDPEGVETP